LGAGPVGSVEHVGEVVPGQIPKPALLDGGEVEHRSAVGEPEAPVVRVEVAQFAGVRPGAVDRFDVSAHLPHQPVDRPGLSGPGGVAGIEFEQ
jgi:hypothetical protein